MTEIESCYVRRELQVVVSPGRCPLSYTQAVVTQTQTSSCGSMRLTLPTKLDTSSCHPNTDVMPETIPSGVTYDAVMLQLEGWLSA